MSSKSRKKVPLKGYVVKLAETVIDHCCKQFGYTKKPILKERQMPNAFCAFQANDSKKDRYIIYYNNYRMFLAFCNEAEDKDSIMYLCAVTAVHECRHYYQYRQFNAKKPKESAETIAAWKYDYEHYEEKARAENSLEKDASEFSYKYMEKYFGLTDLQEAVTSMKKDV